MRRFVNAEVPTYTVVHARTTVASWRSNSYGDDTADVCIHLIAMAER
jgi:hypothetical protein